MAPKARGRGGRGGSSARGGRGAVSAAPSASNPTESREITSELQSATTDNKPEALLTGDGSSIEATNTTTFEAPEIVAGELSAASSQTVSESHSAAPEIGSGNQNLGGAPARPGTPAVRRTGSSRGKKPAVVKPTFTGRRSKQERDALEKAANEREKARLAARQKEEAARKKEQERGQKRDRGNHRGRGGYGSAVSGPFSMGSIARTKDRRSEHRITTSGSRAMRVKREDIDADTGVDGDGDVRRSGEASTKREHNAYVSSEDEEVGAIPRQDIDFIEVSSGEDEPGASDYKSNTQRSRLTPGLLPVRIGRREHRERVVGINTEASSEATAKILQEAEAAGTEVKAEEDATAQRKGKGKVREVEITGVRKPYQGMWSESEGPTVKVKPEPTSDDEGHIPGLEAVNISGDSAYQEPGKKQIISPDVEKRARPRAKVHAEPIMQTDEERAEYARWQNNLQALRAELGPPDEISNDADGHATSKNAGASASSSKAHARDEHTYLFHFPPIMPKLAISTIKQEPSESVQTVSAQNANASATKNKVEEKEIPPSAYDFHVKPGHAGKLRVHDSGRATLSWGDERFDVTAGQEMTYLHETVDLEHVPKHMRVVNTESGDATAFGKIKGKFVVVPSWTKMLK